MLKGEYLLKRFQDTWEVMMSHFYAFSETQDLEALHWLRVEMKKLFALITLLEFSTCDFDFLGCLKSIKTIFKQTGEIRDIQLTIQLIMSYANEGTPSCELQHTKLTNLIGTFCLKAALYENKLRKAHDSISEKICDIENSCVLNWYERELTKLSHLFAKKCDRINMHEGRKVLKMLLYVYAILQNPLQQKLNLDKDYIRNLQSAIGKWHDVFVSTEILSRSKLVGEETMKKLSDQKEKLLRLCRVLLRQFPEKCYRTKNS